MAYRKPELERIIKDLKGFVAQSCQADPDAPHDFVTEMCNEACLMLEEAREELNEREGPGAKNKGADKPPPA